MTSAAEFTGTVAGDAVDTASITGAAAAAANGAAAAENSILHYITLHRNYLKSPMVKNC